VRKLASEGTTIVLTTHYLEEAEELADRVGVINEGRLLLVEDKASVMRRFGERRLVVTFEHPLADLPEDARRFSPILSEDRRTLTYVEREGTPPSGELLRALYAQGLSISDVETRRSRLEDVLLEILRGRPKAA
jgi:ABC-2 type transport system ATP-binding protein